MGKPRKHVWLFKDDIAELERVKRKENLRSIAEAVHKICYEWSPNYIEKLREERKRLKIAVERLEDERDHVSEKLELALRENERLTLQLNDFKTRELLRIAQSGAPSVSSQTRELPKQRVMAFEGMTMEELISKVDSTREMLEGNIKELQGAYDYLSEKGMTTCIEG